jgi:hypothetical protein
MTINEDRSIITKIRTWSREALAGFTGRCLAIFRDGPGNIIDVQASSPYGVNGEWIPGSPSDRTDVWRSGLSEDDAAIVAAVEFEFWVNGPSFNERFGNLLKQVKEGIDLVAEGTNHPNGPDLGGAGPLVG